MYNPGDLISELRAAILNAGSWAGGLKKIDVCNRFSPFSPERALTEQNKCKYIQNGYIFMGVSVLLETSPQKLSFPESSPLT